MSLHMETSLAAHRHGRFFVSQVNAKPVNEGPENGLVIMHGKVFQRFDATQQQDWWNWSSRPGCVVLLLPPFAIGSIVERLDWQITAREEIAKSSDGSLADLLSSEVTVNLTGSDGEFDRTLGHQWENYSVNTRYFKQHLGCGVFAASCLPLWSISLLDHASDMTDWFKNLLALAGKAGASQSRLGTASENSLEKTDYTVMVCMQAWGLQSVREITSILRQIRNSPITLADSDVAGGIDRLLALGLIDDSGLTDIGLEKLSDSPYWGYIDSLRELGRQ